MSKKLVVLTCLLLLGSLLVACGPEATPTPTKAPPPTEAKPTPIAPTSTPAPKVLTRPLVLCADLEAVSMDPHVNNYAYSAVVQYGPYESLLRWQKQPDGTWKWGPYLAKSWEISSDGLQYTLKLQEGVKFSDGTPFNAEAVKWNLERLAALKLQPSTKVYKIAALKVETAGDYTVKITLPEPYAPFLFGLIDAGFVSPTAAKAHQKEGKYGQYGDYAQAWLSENAVGTGPYLLKEWRRGESATLVKNPDYWQGWKGNHLESIVVKLVKEIATRKTMLQKGDCDWTLRLSETDVPELKANPNLVPWEVVGASALTIQIRPHGPFADKRVRKAVALAFDYDAFANKILLGQAKVANSPLTPADLGWDSTLPPFKRDLEKAKKLMAEAGYPTGLPGEYEMWTIPVFQWFLRSQAELLRANLADIGIKVKIVEYADAAPLLAGIFNPDVNKEPTFFPWTFRPRTGDPDTTLRDHFHSSGIPPKGVNGAFYNNPQVDKLMDQAVKESAWDKRAPAYRELQRILIEDQPFLWLAYPSGYYFMSKEFKGYNLAPLQDCYMSYYYEMWLEGK